MTADEPILIVGAGIGGLSAAIALDHAGFPVQVFERAPEVRAIGAGISLWMNAMLALRCLGVESQVLSAGNRFDRTEIQSYKATILRRFSLADLAEELGARPVGISRMDLIRILHRASGEIPIHTNSDCVGYEQNDKCAILHLADGRSVRGCAVIGADGVRSNIRTQLVGGRTPTFAGSIEWRGISESTHGAEVLQGCLFTVFGPGDTGGVGWYVDANRVCWSIGAVSSSPGNFKKLGPQTSRLRQLVRGWKGPLPYLVENTPEETIHLSDYYRPVPTMKWGEGRVTLLGDSAHAMGTVFGQGGAQTIEDAVVLAECLSQSADIVPGLRLYEQRRMQRVGVVIRLVQEILELLRYRSTVPPKRWLRDLAVRFVPAPMVIGRFLQIMTFPEGRRIATALGQSH